MIVGTINAKYEAVICLRLSGSGGSIDVDAVVDTGFNGSLAMPVSLAQSLGLTVRAAGSAILADGSTRSYDLYGVQIEWDGISFEVLASAFGDELLLGMRLLRSYELRMEITPGGRVEAMKLP